MNEFHLVRVMIMESSITHTSCSIQFVEYLYYVQDSKIGTRLHNHVFAPSKGTREGMVVKFF